MKKKVEARIGLRIAPELLAIIRKDSEKNDEGNISRTIRKALTNYYFAKGESTK